MIRVVFLLLLVLIMPCARGQEIRRVKITDLEMIIANSKTPVVINMWATWCKPCVEEIPFFLKEVNKHNREAGTGDSIQLLLVSLDFKEAFPKAITTFAAKRKFNATMLWLDETDADYFCPKIDAKWSGAIPATLFINNKTGYRKFVESQLTPGELQKEIMAILKKD